MKRRALLIALLALVLLLLTGCGSNKTASAPVESTLPVENAQPVTNQTGTAIINDAAAEPVSDLPDILPEDQWDETLNDEDYAREAALYASGAYDDQSGGLTYAGSGQFFVMTKTEGDGTRAKFSRQELSAFPSDFPDNYSWGTDIVLLDKYLEIGDVGCEPRILAQFTWLGKSYTISVPSVPSLLKAYAEENGYCIVKIFVESNNDMAAVENAMNNCVFFYTGTIRTVLDYAAPTEYTLEWSTVSFVPSTLFCSPGVVDKKVPFNVAYSQLQYSSFSYKASNDQILLYPQGSWAFWPNDPTFGNNPGILTITHAQTSLQMSDEEAAWLVNYMQGVNIHYGQPNSALLSDPNFNVSETY